jgi:hypothetical protein
VNVARNILNFRIIFTSLWWRRSTGLKRSHGGELSEEGRSRSSK